MLSMRTPFIILTNQWTLFLLRRNEHSFFRLGFIQDGSEEFLFQK